MTRSFLILLISALLISCAAPDPFPAPVVVQPAGLTAPTQPLTPVSITSLSPGLNPAPVAPVPVFEHIVVIIFENEAFDTVIDNPEMPVFNRLAQENTLLTQFHAIRHPSLPNYIALIGGDTFGIEKDCNDCFIDAPSLPDLIEANGRSWKTYQENIPKPCYVGSNLLFRAFRNRYAQKHNPFVYFDPVRRDQERCENSVVSVKELSVDIQADNLPNFSFITPNMCNIGHDCSEGVTDNWLDDLQADLVPALDTTGQSYLVVLTFDEGKGNQSCCGLTEGNGGRIAVVLISPLAKKGFQDDTPYTHYSLLKTIAASWGLTYLGHAADDETALITAPWR